MTKNIKISQYTPEYKDCLIDLLKHMWKDLDEADRKRRFEWRYELNPFQDRPFIYLAVDGNKVAGFRAFVVQLFQKNVKSLLVFSPADAIVHPDYRRKGIFSKLNNAFFKDVNKILMHESVILNLTSNRFSTPGCLKQSWQQTDGLKRFFYKISITSFLKSIIKRSSDQNKRVPLFFSQHEYEIEISSTILSHDLACFSQKNRNQNTWANLRNKAYYSWKYTYKPENYTVVYCRKANTLNGYLIIKRLSGTQGSLEEYAATNSRVFQLMINIATNKLKISFLRTWAFAPEDKILLRKACFIPESNKLLKLLGKERLPVLVRPITPNPTESDFIKHGLDIRKIEHWQIQPADRH